MESLSLQDPVPGPGQGSSQGPPSQNGGQLGPQGGPPQLPPQMFTTAAQLLDLTDKKLLLVLRDGRKILGVLRSWDQFANLVLTSTVERYYVNTTPAGPSSPTTPPTSPRTRKLYADAPRGTYLVRGENVLLLGEVDLDKDDEPPPGYEEAKLEEVFTLKREEERLRKASDKVKARKVGELWGGEMEASGEVLF